MNRRPFLRGRPAQQRDPIDLKRLSQASEEALIAALARWFEETAKSELSGVRRRWEVSDA